jgi:hypothetical protein
MKVQFTRPSFPRALLAERVTGKKPDSIPGRQQANLLSSADFPPNRTGVDAIASLFMLDIAGAA